jgi:hypothetical protein
MQQVLREITAEVEPGHMIRELHPVALRCFGEFGTGDTVWIYKRSSAELSEAIDLVYCGYQESRVLCIRNFRQQRRGRDWPSSLRLS